MEIIKKEEVVLTKRENWANVGESIHYTEIALKNKSEKIISMLIFPNNFEQVLSAEESLKFAKKEKSVLVEERMKVTDTLRKVTERLMQPEKEVDAAFPNIEAAILKLKKEKAQQETNERAKNDELKRLKEGVLKWINDADAHFKTITTNQCTKAFEYALGDGNVTEEGLEKYLEACLGKFTFITFTTTKPTVKLSLVSSDEYNAIWDECSASVIAPQVYLDAYKNELKEKFGFYGISLKNKEGAIQQQRLEDSRKAEEQAKELQNKEIAASLASVATSFEATPTSNVKPLKSVYELDMEETHENSLLIISAFVANYSLTKKSIERLKPFNLSVGQMANALVAIKNKDDKFSCTGINFKQIDKL